MVLNLFGAKDLESIRDISMHINQIGDLKMFARAHVGFVVELLTCMVG